MKKMTDLLALVALSVVILSGCVEVAPEEEIPLDVVQVSLSPYSPPYAIVASGSHGVTDGIFRFRAGSDKNITQVGLELASGAPADVAYATVWYGSQQLGSAVFVGSNKKAVSFFPTAMFLPKNSDRDITAKVDLVCTGYGCSGNEGDLIQVKIDPKNTRAIDAVSGLESKVEAVGDLTPSGVRMFKSFPKVSLDWLNSTGVADGKLVRFKVTADMNGGISLDQFKFSLATTSASVSLVNVFGYTDSGYTSPIYGFTSGQLSAANISPVATTFVISPSSVINIPAGTTYYFEARGTVVASSTTYSVVTTLMGDSMYCCSPEIGNMGSAGNVAEGDNFVWSPNTFTTPSPYDRNWTNGYGVEGLPSTGLTQVRTN